MWGLIQVTTDGAYALSLAVVVAVIYLAVVRFMDLNEKEPLWAVGLLFFLGAITAAILPLLVSSTVLELSTLWGAVAEELAKFIAFALGVVALGAAARARGWSEISGLMDGVVYGTAVGFGFATGEAFVRELSFGGALGAVVGGGPFATLWTTALSGLSDGLFGAIIGAGFGVAVGARSALERVGYPIAGLIGAILAHAGFTLLAEGNSLGGSTALIRTWIALLIPVVFVVAVAAYALTREKRAIREELATESETGVVTDEELGILRSFAARRSAYARAFMKGDFDGWLALRQLHNRQVQLALAKGRASGESDPERRAAAEAEVEQLRATILWLKRSPELSAQASPGSREAGA
jgi:hypothetical protein